VKWTADAGPVVLLYGVLTAMLSTKLPLGLLVGGCSGTNIGIDKRGAIIGNAGRIWCNS